MERAVLKSNAKAQLKGKWGSAVLSFLVGVIITSIFSGISNFVDSNGLKAVLEILTLLVTGAICYGFCNISLMFANNNDIEIGDLFSGFNGKVYLKTLGLTILVGLAVIIGFVLLIIPGIVVGLMYSQSFFILCEDNNKGIIQCMKESSDMMKGHKWELFVLELSFILWDILCIITFGIASLWVTPYIYVTYANYYKELKNASV